MKKKASWIVPLHNNRNALFRLFCIPYAGGGPQVYKSWGQQFPKEVEVYTLLLPGRGARLFEPLFHDLPLLVEAIAEELKPFLDKPIAFFGHSMGALLSFELAHYFIEHFGKDKAPLHLMLSGRAAPTRPPVRPPLHNLPHDELIEELKRLNGTPPELLANAEMMELMLGTLRADFSVCETYKFRERPALDFPLTILGGLTDKDIKREDLEPWKDQTTANSSLHMLEGDHFFIHSNERQVLEMANRVVARLLVDVARAG